MDTQARVWRLYKLIFDYKHGEPTSVLLLPYEHARVTLTLTSLRTWK
jgi:hypothetical protein